MFNEKDFPILSPVVCACSNSQEHKIEHEECRCTGWHRFREQMYAPYAEKGIYPANLVDELGFEHCRYCGKVHNWKDYLVVCDTCGRKFRGPRPWFPIDYDCENCG
jgi:hypothetical protein